MHGNISVWVESQELGGAVLDNVLCLLYLFAQVMGRLRQTNVMHMIIASQLRASTDMTCGRSNSVTTHDRVHVATICPSR